jgi:hypothetical protein
MIAAGLVVVVVLAAVLGWLAWLVFDLRSRCRRQAVRLRVLARKQGRTDRVSRRADRRYKNVEDVVNRHTTALEEIVPVVNRLST